MWRNEQQQCQAIRALLGPVHLEHLWTEQGPTDEACHLLRVDGGPLSHGQAVMLRVAFDLWDGWSGGAKVGDLVSVLDGGNLFAVGSLLMEMSKSTGPDVEAWVAYATGGRRGGA